ncbi:uncharacterized protein LOC116203134 [Punica granatum]|uniref:DUF7870 domain-containing protein n=2 Tax=Punica granatum TaxID=22663 RepID=A0A218WGG4_PUNGR|nr:uncharacterized protein LOC116203134 [Punica granatum]OWM71321.1 hypothetical protein CDL15_Pgr011449 [Punica granatum]PKI40420.1 hypothetical protein CRG98_039197 [Punica granatum]
MGDRKVPKIIAMESLPQFHCHQTKRQKVLKRLLASKSITFEGNEGRYLIGKLLLPRYLRVMTFLGQLVAFMLVVVSFPRLRPMFDSFLSTVEAEYRFDPVKFEVLPMLFRDLANEGLLRGGEKAVFLSNQADYEAMDGSRMILFDEVMDHISTADLERQSSIQDNTFDFAFTYEFHDAASRFIDRTLKVGGIAAIHLGGVDPNDAGSFHIPRNYKIVYIRRFDSPVLAIKKTSEAAMEPSQTRRQLCGLTSQKKKEALKNLEDVLLEPPRAATGRSKRYLKKTRYLPDLMGDTLEGYPRRVFIDVGPPEKDGESTGTKWFIENYPTRNLDFDMYKMETVASEGEKYPVSSLSSSISDQHESEAPQIGMSEWLRKNVKEEEYVVMKADAEVVEEMMRGRATGLVDELFLECKPKGKKKPTDANGSGNKRAYWECLALYGRLRDEGVAVHQWWG